MERITGISKFNFDQLVCTRRLETATDTIH